MHVLARGQKGDPVHTVFLSFHVTYTSDGTESDRLDVCWQSTYHASLSDLEGMLLPYQI